MSVRSRHTRTHHADRDSSPRESSAEQAQALVELTTMIVSGCVRDPDQVDVSYDPQQDRLIIEVASKDRGVLIGRGGRTLRALEDALSLSRHYAGQTSANANTDLPLIEITTARRDSSD